MIKHILGILLCISFAQSSYSQYSFKTSLIKHSGGMGYLFKPSPGFELGYMYGNLASQTNIGIFIGFYQHIPRKDTFPRFGFINKNGPTRFVPGYSIWQSYYVIPLSINYEFALLDKSANRLVPYVGLDLSLLLASYKYQEYIVTVLDSYEEGGKTAVSILPKIGGMAILSDQLQLSFGLGYNIAYNEYRQIETYWKPFISIAYFR